MGNYNGFVVYDVANPAAPRMVAQVHCPGSQNDITVSGTCSTSRRTPRARRLLPARAAGHGEGVVGGHQDLRHLRRRNPRYIKSVETACGSHTHTVVPGGGHVYLYVSSYSPSAEFPDCQPPHDSISIVDVPLKAPTTAKVVATPNLFPDGGYTHNHGLS